MPVAKAPPYADLQSAFCSDPSLSDSGLGVLHDLRSPCETSGPLQGRVQGMPRGLWCPCASGIPLQGRCLERLHSLTGEWSFCCQEWSLAQGTKSR